MKTTSNSPSHRLSLTLKSIRRSLTRPVMKSLEEYLKLKMLELFNQVKRVMKSQSLIVKISGKVDSYRSLVVAALNNTHMTLRRKRKLTRKFQNQPPTLIKILALIIISQALEINSLFLRKKSINKTIKVLISCTTYFLS